MKKTIAVLLGISLLLTMSACSSKRSVGQKTDHRTSFSTAAETQGGIAAGTEVPTDSLTSKKEETAPGLSEQPKEEAPMKQAQFYITVKGTVFTADFADNASADAFRDLLRKGDLTICMSDYGSFEKVGSIGTSLPRKDTRISAAAGDVMLYQGNRIVIFYGTNTWSYSRLGKIDGAAAEALLSAFGSGDADITFSLTKPQ